MCYSSLVEKNFETLGSRLDAWQWDDAFDVFHKAQQVEHNLGAEKVKEILGLTQKPRSTRFKWLEDDGRIYPNYFAPVIINQDDARRVVPMRFRLRPSGSRKEVPTKYNLYNARIESLSSSRIWSTIFGRNHALIPIKQIYEWVDKKIIGIAPTDTDLLLVPVIYDQWSSPDQAITFQSFAIITHPAPPDIEALGHHRCPVILNSTQINDWLSPKTSRQAFKLLEDGVTGSFKRVA